MFSDDLVHVVRFVRRIGDDRVEARNDAVRIVVASELRRRLAIILREKREERAREVGETSASSAATRCATPLRVACVAAPPSSANVTSSPVTVLMISGPVINICEIFSVMRMKSVIAGE